MAKRTTGSRSMPRSRVQNYRTTVEPISVTFAHFKKHNLTKSDDWFKQELDKSASLQSTLTDNQRNIRNENHPEKPEEMHTHSTTRNSRVPSNKRNSRKIALLDEIEKLERAENSQTTSMSDDLDRFSHEKSFYFNEEIELLEQEGHSGFSRRIQADKKHIRRSLHDTKPHRTFKEAGLQVLFCAHCEGTLQKSHNVSDLRHLPSVSNNNEISEIEPGWNLDALRNAINEDDSDSDNELKRSSKAWKIPKKFDSDDSD